MSDASADLSAKAAPAKLTQRQKDILAMLQAGKANKEIASVGAQSRLAVFPLAKITNSKLRPAIRTPATTRPARAT